MAVKYAEHFAKAGPTPQREPIPGREAEQVKNQAGGFVFQIGDFDRLDRFLILGSEGNTYYATEKKMTVDNAQAVLRCIKADGLRTVNRIVEISDSGRAPKNDPALFALALCAAADDVKTRQAALAALPSVARIGTHLFHFAEYVNAQRGWGRALRSAIGNWYNEQPIDKLANQVAKYQQRDGWSNRDLLRLGHPKTTDPIRADLYNWVCGRKDGGENRHGLLSAFDAVTANPDAPFVTEAIHLHDLPRECIPTELLNDSDIWAALLEKMPMTAMIRNLGKMTSVGLLKPLAKETKLVVERLADEAALKKARVHPVSLLIALKTYNQGHGEKGKLVWNAVSQICDALDGAFYKAFKAVEPTGKNILLALDVSGSMGGGQIAGTSLTPREGTAAIALVTAATEENYFVFGFSRRFMPLDVSPRMRLDTVIKNISGLPFEGTDCALPMMHAMQHDLPVDAFVILTDNETWGGGIHATQALAQYRKKSGRDAKCIVVGMTATEFSIADPKDNGMLDIVGFDTNAPALISDFIRG